MREVHYRVTSTLLQIIVFSIFASGCAQVTQAYHTTGDTLSEWWTAAVHDEESEESGLTADVHVRNHDDPFALHIARELNDGQRIHVLGSVDVVEQWPRSAVLLKLSGFDWNGELHSQSTALSEFTQSDERYFKPGENIEFALSMPSPGVTDYQIELVWGEEARAALKTEVKDTGSVRLTSVRILERKEPCSQGYSNCGVRFSVEGQLVNETGTSIQEIVLGVRMIEKAQRGREVDFSTGILENEELVAMNELDLAPGMSRPVQLALDTVFSEEQARQFEPGVRVVSFQH